MADKIFCILLFIGVVIEGSSILVAFHSSVSSFFLASRQVPLVLLLVSFVKDALAYHFFANYFFDMDSSFVNNVFEMDQLAACGCLLLLTASVLLLAEHCRAWRSAEAKYWPERPTRDGTWRPRRGGEGRPWGGLWDSKHKIKRSKNATRGGNGMPGKQNQRTLMWKCKYGDHYPFGLRKRWSALCCRFFVPKCVKSRRICWSQHSHCIRETRS